jgi:heme peroxidase
MPLYNQMRNAYGLASKTSFTSITGESTDSFPRDPLLTPGNEVNDPNCLDIIAAFDINGNPTDVANDNATRVVRRCTVAAKLKAIYGSVSTLDAFTGMLAEKHISGSELGELQRAIWQDQFGAARDGDRFFYRNDPLQSYIRNTFGIDSRRTLAQVIAANTDVPQADLPANVFRLPGSPDVGAGKATAAQPANAREQAGIGVTANATTSDLTRYKGKKPGKGAQQPVPAAISAGYPASRQVGRRRTRTA